MRRRPAARRAVTEIEPLIAGNTDSSLLDLVDNVLTQGVMVTGDVVIGLANIDLVYLRVSALLCAADRVLPSGRARRRRR